MTKAVFLKAGREKSVLRHHPWIFSGAIQKVVGSPGTGETVDVVDSRGSFLARGGYSPESQIRVRLWTWDADEQIDESFFRRRLIEALTMRNRLRPELESNAIRLVYAESDKLPGLIVDRYSETLVIQILSSGAEYWRSSIIPLLADLTGIERIYERSDMDVRRLEGLSERAGLISGDPIMAPIVIHEGDLRFHVDVTTGHKTGFYLDQRSNRRRLVELTRDKQVLDCFCYTGGFTISALHGGCQQVVAVDSSGIVLDTARQNLQLNHLQNEQVNFVEGDVFEILRSFRDQNRSFDLIILDPPKFAPSTAQVKRAARGYKDINLLALKLLRPEGNLLTFSCSGGVDAALFQKIVAGAALDAGADVQILEWLFQAADHPVALNFPEGAYLKGLLLRKNS